MPVLLHAARVFDGNDMRTNTSVLVADGKVAQIGSRESFDASQARVIELGDATLLPGFIELHAHLDFQHVPADTVLRHGVTTLRDVGGPVHPPYGGDGRLRVLTSGLIITAPNGYPIPGLGEQDIAIPVASEDEARQAVRTQLDGGAVVIKVALEPGGEHGAPWGSGHGHGHHPHAQTTAQSKSPWPLLPEKIVRAIVDEAHKHGRKVAAHVAEAKGVRIALDAGVDEWAHVPCEAIPDTLLEKAAAQHIKTVTTLDTLSKCPGVAHNAGKLAALGVDLLYGAEVAHPDIPWGIDAQELIYIIHLANKQPIEALRAATAKAGENLNIPLLGTLQPNAPADLIAVKGDPTHTLKSLEYPDLVVSGGKIIVNNFSK